MSLNVAGGEVPLWLPPLVALVVSFFSSMAGISGAVLLLPFQFSVLGFTSPAVSPTNLVFNLVAIPSGVARYIREGRMVWPLTAVVVMGSVPGVVAGGFIRLAYLPHPKPFRIFAGCVLLAIGLRMAADLVRRADGKTTPCRRDCRARTTEFNRRRIAFSFQGRVYSCGTPGIALLSAAVGLVGGIYGIGGGAIIAPFFVAVCGLPVHAIAGATLTGTFATSIFGVAFYSALGVAPHWPLGLLFGAGGMMGMYLGARTQRYVPVRWLKGILAALVILVGAGYLR